MPALHLHLRSCDLRSVLHAWILHLVGDHHQVAATVVARVAQQRASWNRWHIDAEVQRQLRGIVFASDTAREELTERITESALGAHSIRLTRQVDAAPHIRAGQERRDLVLRALRRRDRFSTMIAVLKPY